MCDNGCSDGACIAEPGNESNESLENETIVDLYSAELVPLGNVSYNVSIESFNQTCVNESIVNNCAIALDINGVKVNISCEDNQSLLHDGSALDIHKVFLSNSSVNLNFTYGNTSAYLDESNFALVEINFSYYNFTIFDLIEEERSCNAYSPANVSLAVNS